MKSYHANSGAGIKVLTMKEHENQKTALREALLRSGRTKKMGLSEKSPLVTVVRGLATWWISLTLWARNLNSQKGRTYGY